MSSVGSAGWTCVRSLSGICFLGTGLRRGGAPGSEHLATSLAYAGFYILKNCLLAEEGREGVSCRHCRGGQHGACCQWLCFQWWEIKMDSVGSILFSVNFHFHPGLHHTVQTSFHAEQRQWVTVPSHENTWSNGQHSSENHAWSHDALSVGWVEPIHFQLM